MPSLLGTDLVESVESLRPQIKVLVDEAEGYEPLTARLADIYRDPVARKEFNKGIEQLVHLRLTTDLSVDQVVVGGGYSAAIYASTTEARTGARVYVLEADRLGGAFATTLAPAFYLNSRNRPRGLGLPGTSGALNFIPGGIIQPADLDGREYQTNAEFGFAIRANLSLYAQCVRAEARRIEPNVSNPRSRKFYIYTGGSFPVRTDRIILATGPGVPEITVKGDVGGGGDGQTTFTFPQFLGLFDSKDPFPFRNWKNVAVIGPQDSGSSVIMALLGQGPTDIGPANFNTIEHVTWYGQKCVTKEQYEKVLRGGARSLYASIGRYMPRQDDPGRYFRVYPNPERAYAVEVDANQQARVVYGPNKRLSRAYDHVVICAGFTNSINQIVKATVDGSAGDLPLREELVMDDELGPIARKFVGAEIYKIGPCADLPVTPAERAKSPALDLIPSNSAAAFRYAPRIQRLAEILNPA